MIFRIVSITQCRAYMVHGYCYSLRVPQNLFPSDLNTNSQWQYTVSNRFRHRSPKTILHQNIIFIQLTMMRYSCSVKRPTYWQTRFNLLFGCHIDETLSWGDDTGMGFNAQRIDTTLFWLLLSPIGYLETKHETEVKKVSKSSGNNNTHPRS